MAVNQKATSASWGGGHAPPLDPPLNIQLSVWAEENTNKMYCTGLKGQWQITMANNTKWP